MKISELKIILDNILNEHGDIEVVGSEAGAHEMREPFVENEYTNKEYKTIKAKCLVIQANF